MRLLSVLSIVALIAALAIPTWAEEAPAATNTVCPVSGEAVSEGSVVIVEVDGAKVAIATCGSSESDEAVAANPAKYAAAAKANVKAASDEAKEEVKEEAAE